MAKPKVISVANQKGGVGKSTTVYNLGAGLAMDGKKVLLFYFAVSCPVFDTLFRRITEVYCTTTLLPMLLDEAKRLIDAHNADPEAHQHLRGLISGIDSRLSLLELMYGTDVSGNPFTVTFESLEGTAVTGVWNQPQARIEF